MNPVSLSVVINGFHKGDNLARGLHSYQDMANPSVEHTGENSRESKNVSTLSRATECGGMLPEKKVVLRRDMHRITATRCEEIVANADLENSIHSA